MMRLPPLTDGLMLRRYKRFFADVQLSDGAFATAHCPNTGSMKSCWASGAPVQLSHSDDPRRKLPWTLERIDMGGGWIGVNTGRVNAVMAEALEQGLVSELAGYDRVRREVACVLPGHPPSRLDLRLDLGPGAPAWIEIKNVTLLDGNRLRFPDAASVRGLKHLKLLSDLAARGERAVMLFALNRPEGICFSPAREIDPAYAETLVRVQDLGVELQARRLVHTPDGMVCGEAVPIDLDG
jgi:sugar fermentation stimulation protein A